MAAMPIGHPLPIVYTGIGRWYGNKPPAEKRAIGGNSMIQLHMTEMMEAFRAAGAPMNQIPVYIEDDPQTRNVIDDFFAAEPAGTQAVHLVSKNIAGSMKNYASSHVIFAGHFTNK